MKKRFSLEGRKGAQAQSITVRETDGKDEEQASLTAKAKGGASNEIEELVRLSIVAIDDKPVTQPFEGFDSWKSKMRGYALSAWRDMNVIDEKEAESFLKGGEVVD